MERKRSLRNPLSRQSATSSKLSDEIRLRKFAEQVLDVRQQEIELLEADKEALAKRVSSLERQLAQLSDAEDYLGGKGKRPVTPRDRSPRLQPQGNFITESEAAEAYQKLYRNVRLWVENRLKRVQDGTDSGRLRDWPPLDQRTRFSFLMRDAAKRSLEARRSVDVDQSDEYHVIAVIMQYLSLGFFAKRFYCPLDDTAEDDTLSWVEGLARDMERHPRDLRHGREWRSETLAALTKQAAFKSRRSNYLDVAADDLSSHLAVAFPRASVPELATSVRRSIIEPAADLAHQLHLAADLYTLKWPARNPWTRLEVFKCIDVSSGGDVIGHRRSGSDAAPLRGALYLFDVAPGLFVERVEGDNKLGPRAIIRPAVLVHVGHR